MEKEIDLPERIFGVPLSNFDMSGRFPPLEKFLNTVHAIPIQLKNGNTFYEMTFYRTDLGGILLIDPKEGSIECTFGSENGYIMTEKGTRAFKNPGRNQGKLYKIFEVNCREGMEESLVKYIGMGKK